MYKATKNFACHGKTYFVGDEVPAQVVKAVDASFTEKPKSAKTETKYTLEGE